jgi:hypothetical protein
MMIGDLGIDYGALWQSAKAAGASLIKELPGAVESTVTKAISQKAQSVAAPIIQQIAQEKAQRVITKGNVILFTLGGAALGALIAGGGWKRRTVGGVLIGAAGAYAGTKIGLLTDSA